MAATLIDGRAISGKIKEEVKAEIEALAPRAGRPPGLGVVLARQNFANPAVAIPSAISSLFHSLIGSALAALWRRSPQDSRASSRPVDLRQMPWYQRR